MSQWPQGAESLPPSSDGRPTPWYRKRTWQITGGAVAGLIVLGAIGSATDDRTKDTAKRETAGVSTPSTAGESSPAVPDPDTAPLTNEAKDGGDKNTDAARKEKPLPDLVGKGLQYAQDEAQAAGFFLLTSHDVKGRERKQVYDRNWKVCTQSPEPGATDTKTKVDFGVARIEEDCSAGLPTDVDDVKEGSPMPDLVGRSLNVAADALPRGAGWKPVDVSGAERVVLRHSNWKVCGQTPAAGRPWNGEPIILNTVKIDESCP